MARKNQRELANDLKKLVYRFLRLHDQLKDELDKYYATESSFDESRSEKRMWKILRQIEDLNHEIYNLKGRMADADEILDLYPEYDPHWEPREQAVVRAERQQWLWDKREELHRRQGYGTPNPRRNPASSSLGAIAMAGIAGYFLGKSK